MPSRRHHPQVEPLLASYKICYTKCWLKNILSLQGTNFIAKNCWLLKTLEGLMPILYPNFTAVPILHLEILLISKPEYYCKHVFPPSLLPKLTSVFIPPFPMKITHFHTFPFPLHQNPLTRLKNNFSPYWNPPFPLKTIEDS